MKKNNFLLRTLVVLLIITIFSNKNVKAQSLPIGTNLRYVTTWNTLNPSTPSRDYRGGNQLTVTNIKQIKFPLWVYFLGGDMEEDGITVEIEAKVGITGQVEFQKVFHTQEELDNWDHIITVGGGIYDVVVEVKGIPSGGTWQDTRFNFSMVDYFSLGVDDEGINENQVIYKGDKDKLIQVKELTVDDSKFNLYGTQYAYYKCTNLQTVDHYLQFARDRWSLSYQGMFEGCTSLTSINAAEWMIPETIWHTGIVKNNNIASLKNMFKDCSNFNDPGVANWKVEHVRDFRGMFQNCRSFDQTLNWKFKEDDPTHPSDTLLMENMLDDCGMSCENYGQTITRFRQNNPNVDNIQLGVKHLNCPEGNHLTDRNFLDYQQNWLFVGDDVANDCGEQFITVWDTTKESSEIHNGTSPTSNNQQVNIPVIGNNIVISYHKLGNNQIYGFTQLSNLYYGAEGEPVLVTFPEPGVYVVKISQYTGPARADGILYQTNDEFNLGFKMGAPNVTYGDRNKLLAVKKWGKIKWTHLDYAFKNCIDFEIYGNAGTPDLSDLTSLEGMFYGCSHFNTDISNWDVSTIKNMNSMFRHCLDFNSPLNNWDVRNLETTVEMFREASSFNQPLFGWNLESIKNTSRMFFYATRFNQSLFNWKLYTANISDMSEMFRMARSFNQSLGDWLLKPGNNQVNMHGMISGSGISCANYGWTLNGWATTGALSLNYSSASGTAPSFNPALIPSNVSLGFVGKRYPTSAIVGRKSLIENKGWAIRGDNIGCGEFITIWDTSNPPSTVAGYSNSSRLQIKLPIIGTYDLYWEKTNDPNVHASVVQTITATQGHPHVITFPTPGQYRLYVAGGQFMKSGRIQFANNSTGAPYGDAKKIIKVEKWGYAIWSTMKGAFYGCSNLQMGDDAGAPNLNKVTDMGSMFKNCSNFNSDISFWNVENVEDMQSLFEGDTVFNQPLEDWEVKKVKYMHQMFKGAKAFNQPLNDWNTEKLNYIHEIFKDATSFNQPLNHWDTEKVSLMSDAFNGATSFNQSLGSWKIRGSVFMDRMLNNCGMDCDNYGATLTGWANDPITGSNITLGATNIRYPIRAVTKRNILRNNKGWTIQGDLGGCGEFMTLWDTTKEPSTIYQNASPTSSNKQINFPAIGEDYIIYWEKADDPSIHNTIMNVTTTELHPRLIEFPSAGQYKVYIDGGTFNRVKFANYAGTQIYGDVNKLMSVEKWGKVKWSSMQNAFEGCVNMNISDDAGAPDLSLVTSMKDMFKGATSFNSNINTWDVSHVTDMSGMFSGATAFNQPLDQWEVDNVQDMGYMFRYATAFDQPLNGWNIENVRSFHGMFLNAESFNQPLNQWNVSNARDMGSMLAYATSFDQSLGDWTLNPKGDYGRMLNNCGMGCDSYGSTLSGWYQNTATPNNITMGVDNLSYPSNLLVLHQKLIGQKGWTLEGDRMGCGDFITVWDTTQEPVEISSYNQSSANNEIFFPGVGEHYTIYWEKVNDPSQNYLYDNVNSTLGSPSKITFPTPGQYRLYVSGGTFNQICFLTGDNTVNGDLRKLIRIEQWGDIQWATMKEAFKGCQNMDLIIGSDDAPNLENVTDMSEMFFACSSLGLYDNQPTIFNRWEVSNVTDMHDMFRLASNFNYPLDTWDVSNVTSMNNMFMRAEAFDQSLGTWNLNPNGVTMENMLDNCGMSCDNYGLTLKGWADTISTPENITLGATGLSYPATVINKHYKLTQTKGWTIQNDEVGCGEFVTIWNTQLPASTIYNNVTAPSQFNQITFPGIGENYTVTYQNLAQPHMVETITVNSSSEGHPAKINFPMHGQMWRVFVSGGTFNQIKFTNNNGDRTYGDLNKLVSVEKWGDIEWADMISSFQNCPNLNVSNNAGRPNLSLAESCSRMFKNCTTLNSSNIGSWDMFNITDISQMFYGATQFNASLGSWRLNNLTTASYMFNNSGMDCSHMTSTLRGWANYPGTKSGVNFSHSLQDRHWGDWTAANKLVSNKSWYFSTSYGVYRKDCETLWTGAENTNPNNPNNWVPAEVPNMDFTGNGTAKIVFAHHVDNNDAQDQAGNYSGSTALRDLKFISGGYEVASIENYTDKKIVVRPSASLLLRGEAKGSEQPFENGAGFKRILLAGEGGYNSNFVTTKDNVVYATVEMDSKGRKLEQPVVWTDDIPNSTWYTHTFTEQNAWQFFGVPITRLKANPTFNGSFLRIYDESYNGGSLTPGKDDRMDYLKWHVIASEDSLYAFNGYEVTTSELTPTKYYFMGQLNTNDIDLPISTRATHTRNGIRYGLGQNLFGNSYTANLKVSSIIFPEELEEVVFLYNTGTLTQWGETKVPNNQIGNQAGQYIAIPKNNESIYDGIIPPMNGFLVIFKDAHFNPNYEGTLGLRYDESSFFMKPRREQTAPQQELSYLRIGLDSKSTHDDVWLCCQEGTTEGFDNGWDGRKFFGTPTAFIFSDTESGAMQVNTSETLANKVLTFYANKDKEYQLTIIKKNLDAYKDLTLLDLMANKPIRLDKDTTIYKFTASKSDVLKKRFKILDTADMIDGMLSSKSKLFGTYDNHILTTVNNTKFEEGRIQILNVSGAVIFEKHMGIGLNAYDINLKEGVYIVHLEAGYAEYNFKIMVK